MTYDLFPGGDGDAFPSPRDFQDTAHRELRAGFTAGHQRQVLMAPTGAGKTFLALRLISESLKLGKRAIFICDRKTLINQTSAVADAYRMPAHGILQASNPRMNLSRPFQIASAQTIQSRGLNDSYDLVVVDEAHTRFASTEKFLEATSGAVVGLSATPFTKGLGKIYSRVVNATTMRELVKSGVLVSMRVLSCARPDMTGAKTSGGEWTAAAAAERGDGLIGDVVLEWMRHASGMKTIVFAPTIAHCEKLVDRFSAAGIRAATFTADTKDDVRAALLGEYRKTDSELRVLVSVEALAKGFDVPDVECVCDCRPLRKSFSTFVQMVGRGLRCAPGKTECILLDFSGNVLRFQPDYEEIYFNGLAELDAGEKLDKEPREIDPNVESKGCPRCGHKPFANRCTQCGNTRPSEIEHAEGAAIEFDVLSGSGRYAKDRPELWAMICTAKRNTAGPSSNPKGSSAHAYREITGAWPSRGWDYESAPRVTPSPALLGKLKSLQIAFRNRRKR